MKEPITNMTSSQAAHFTNEEQTVVLDNIKKVNVVQAKSNTKKSWFKKTNIKESPNV